MKIKALYLHPVKSLGGISVPSYVVDRLGPQWDRRWMVVDEQGQFLTQRQVTQMAAVTSELNGHEVTLRCAGLPALTFDPGQFDDAIGNTVEVTVWRDQVKALLGRNQHHEWISQAIGRPARLVFMPDNCIRSVDPEYATGQDTVSFADGFPLLLTNHESLEWLNRQMDINITMERFRPNVVVEGFDAWQEDEWQGIRMGDLEFTVAKPCSRCVIPTIDPVTLEKQSQVFKALKAHRNRGGDVIFGQNLITKGTGRLSVGQPVEVF